MVKTAKVQVVHETSADAPLQIKFFMHCAKCLDEWKNTDKGAGESPASYARLNVGPTDKGVQVWCVRHNCNVDTWDMRAVVIRESLDQYLRHDESCDAAAWEQRRRAGQRPRYKRPDCTCGLDAILATGNTTNPRRVSSALDEALNSGDGTYRP